MTMRTLLVRGMLVGLGAALLALVFAWIFGEPQINSAIAFEEHRMSAGGHEHEVEIVSRGVQQTFGLATAMGLFGVALGGLFALAFALVHARISRFGPRATSALVAGAGFLTVSLLPALKYPANPPSVGSPDTVGMRAATYFALIVISVIIAVVAVQTGHRLAARLGNWNATLVGAAVALVLVAISYLALPTVNEVPRGFPGAVLWNFRIASLGVQAVFWTALGLGFGALTERSLAVRPRKTPVPVN
ncbi:CbtA family protein [Streptosporangium sp. NPDC051022]|uniref:CbtA family protein n=1 Tax=Streptosporangium sp. NPDC051022 TaxID=3155752 RepID=UPI00343930E5